MLDFLTTPFEWFANVVQYSLIFMAIIILVLTIGAVVAIPIGLKQSSKRPRIRQNQGGHRRIKIV